MVLVLWFALAQAESPEALRALIEQLNVADVEARDAAEQKLVEIGPPARARLEAAAGGGNLEVANRARRILKRIRIGDHATPRFLAVVEGAEARLLSDDPHAWTEVFLDAAGMTGELAPDDLRGPAGPAFRNAGSDGERRLLCRLAQVHRLRVTVPEIRKYLGRQSGDLRGDAARALGMLGTKDVVPDLVALLQDSYLYARAGAAEALADLGAAEAAEGVVRLLHDPVPYVRRAAASALCRLGRREGVDWILESPDGSLLDLNAFRRPVPWKRLCSVDPGGDVSLKMWVGQAGYRWVEDAEKESEPDSDEVTVRLEEFRRPGERFREFALRSIPSGREAILEKDSLRLVAREEALKFWKEWWVRVRVRGAGR